MWHVYVVYAYARSQDVQYELHVGVNYSERT